MEEETIKKFHELCNVDSPHPENFNTQEVVESNGYVSLLKKEDGTYCLKNETTGQEDGSFLTEQEARKNFEDIVNDENSQNN